MTRARVVVVGGGYAGVIAAQRIARRGVRLAEVTLVNASDTLVNRIRLHEVAAGSAPVRRPLARLLHGTGAALRVAKVERIDAVRKRLTLRSADGSGDSLDFDFLVLATGSVTDVSAVPGIAEHAHTLAGHEAALALREAAARGGRLIVCGGGATAVEAAAELAERFSATSPRAKAALRVQLVTRGKILTAAGGTARAHALVALARLGAEVIEDASILAVERDAVVTAGGVRLPFDACLWAGGFVAAPLARDSGLPVDARGQVAASATLAASAAALPWLYVAGDAGSVSGHDGAPLEMSCKCALPTGATAAASVLATLLGLRPEPLRFGDSGMCVSLGRRDAAVHLRRRDGSDTGRIYRGRLGAFIKEGIVRYVTGALALERFFPTYCWLAPARQLPAPGADVAS